jgi:nicotinate phosphoribosyltransferase
MADPNDPGLLSASQTSLLIDQYEITMARSFHRLGMNEPSVFELFVRKLPPHRDWLVVCGLGPTLRLISEMRFGPEELEYLDGLGCDDEFISYLRDFRFSGDVDAMPEGTIAFPNEPLIRVTAPRIEAQMLETLLLNQINFQTMIATKAARVVLAANGEGDSVVDFSPRRDHGVDAAMKAARATAVAGLGGTSNVAAAMRYGLRPVGTMAHSYVLSFESEEEAFEAFMRDNPDNAVLLVDTYDTLEGVRRAIAASQRTGIPLAGIRLDSGELAALARDACSTRRAGGRRGSSPPATSRSTGSPSSAGRASRSTSGGSARSSGRAGTRRWSTASTRSSPTFAARPGEASSSARSPRKRCRARSRSSAVSAAGR